jgi:hypothetical protein
MCRVGVCNPFSGSIGSNLQPISQRLCDIGPDSVWTTMKINLLVTIQPLNAQPISERRAQRDAYKVVA